MCGSSWHSLTPCQRNRCLCQTCSQSTTDVIHAHITHRSVVCSAGTQSTTDVIKAHITHRSVVCSAGTQSTEAINQTVISNCLPFCHQRASYCIRSCYCYGRSVCPSVRLSHSSVLSRRMKIKSCGLQYQVGQSF